MSTNPKSWVWGVYDTDNYGGDYPNERWVIQPWIRKAAAEVIAAVLNNEAGEHSHRWYKVGDRDYKLQPGFEP